MIDPIDDNDSTGWSQPSITAISGLESMRVMQMAQFLPKHERDALFDAACANQEAFQCPGIPGSNEGGALYLSSDSEEFNQLGVGPVREAFECLSKRILRLLPTLFTALGVKSFPVPRIPLTLVNGLNGHSGCPHADENGGRFKISLLYYFHRVPKAFRGGDLEFYATDAGSPSGHNNMPCARVDNKDNLLVAFPSQTFHGITDVQCDSNEFADGRFAAIGFLGPQ